MAKCRGPLFSENASGKLKSGITFSQRKSGQQVRFQKSQTDFLNPARVAARSAYTSAAAAWSALSSIAKAVYIARAIGKPYSGYNLFMQENISFETSGIYGVGIYAVRFYGFSI